VASPKPQPAGRVGRSAVGIGLLIAASAAVAALAGWVGLGRTDGAAPDVRTLAGADAPPKAAEAPPASQVAPASAPAADKAVAGAVPVGVALASPREIAAFAGKHCLGCHSAKALKGGFDMEDLLAQADVGKNPAAWHGVLERIVSRDMPPADHKRRPTEDEYRAGEDWVRGQLRAHEALAAASRPRPMRRLNRDEYNRTVQAIFGLPGYRPADAFPPDDAVDGFTNIGEGLNLSAVLVEQYLAAGAEIARLALSDAPRPESKKHVFSHGNKEYARTLRGHDPGGAIHKGKWWVGDHLYVEVGVPPGMYAVRLFATPRNLAGRPGYIPNFQYRANSVLVHQGDAPIQEGVPMRQEFLLPHLKGGQLNLDFRWVNGFPDNNWLRAQGLRLPEWSDKEAHPRRNTWDYIHYVYEPALKKDPNTPYPFPYFEDFGLEIEGPLFPDGFPLSRFQRENAAALAAKDSAAVAKWLLPQLFRRPAAPEEIAGFAATVERAERQLAEAKPPVPAEKRYPEAMRQALQQALVSPHFLFLVEPGPVGRMLNDHELAARLSYFLWGCPPDAELAKLADAGKLRPALAEQTKRMLADPRAAGFVDRFTTEWLGLEKLSTLMPEPELYRRFDNQGLLRQDMAAEPRAMMAHLLRENGSLYDLLDCDYAFLNDRLADHCHLPSLWSMFPLKREGFEPVSGGRLRKVKLPADANRGGLVTMAAFLALTSENSRTSPVKRGVWILEKVFNRTPPPPPPNVNGVLPDTAAGTTVTEKLKLHRNAANCAGCHARIDPLGVALENFDVIGEWRDREPPHIDPASPVANMAAVRARLKLGQYDPLPTFPIDTAFSMGGVEGQGVPALKKYLLANKDRFARGFTEKLATYALGRRHLITDEPELERIRTAAAKDGFRFRDLIVTLVESRMFQTR
jgi:hypothetical protein